MDPFVQQILTAGITGAFAAGGAYAAIRVELRWLRRDVDRLNKRVFPTNPAPLQTTERQFS
jgi:hypothetical protein